MGETVQVALSMLPLSQYEPVFMNKVPLGAILLLPAASDSGMVSLQSWLPAAEKRLHFDASDNQDPALDMRNCEKPGNGISPPTRVADELKREKID